MAPPEKASARTRLVLISPPQERVRVSARGRPQKDHFQHSSPRRNEPFGGNSAREASWADAGARPFEGRRRRIRRSFQPCPMIRSISTTVSAPHVASGDRSSREQPARPARLGKRASPKKIRSDQPVSGLSTT